MNELLFPHPFVVFTPLHLEEHFVYLVYCSSCWRRAPVYFYNSFSWLIYDNHNY